MSSFLSEGKLSRALMSQSRAAGLEYGDPKPRRRCSAFLLHYLTDLHDAGNISVVSLVGDEIGGGGGKRALQIG